MQTSTRRTSYLLVLFGGALVAGTAQAGPPDEFVGLGPAVAMEELAGQHGRQGADLAYQINSSTQQAAVANNQLQSENTGSNVIDGSAFSGSSGITTVIQNSGNQVVIQDTTQVNVLFQ